MYIATIEIRYYCLFPCISNSTLSVKLKKREKKLLISANILYYHIKHKISVLDFRASDYASEDPVGQSYLLRSVNLQVIHKRASIRHISLETISAITALTRLLRRQPLYGEPCNRVKDNPFQERLGVLLLGDLTLLRQVT